jgi:hypothetical protein
MRHLRSITRLMLTCVAATVVGIVATGTAHAEIVNTPGYLHLKVGDGGQCLAANIYTGAVEQQPCLNTLTEEWSEIPAGVIPGQVMLGNRWTGLCMAVPNSPVNGTKVVQAQCDVGDVRQYWVFRYLESSGGAPGGCAISCRQPEWRPLPG